MKKGYRHRVIQAGDTLEVVETFPGRLGSGFTRQGYQGSTPLAQEKYNEKLRIRELTRIINENFGEDDYHLVLTYERGKRPDSDTAKLYCRQFTRKLTALYRKRGEELRFVKVHAFGERGALHHHLVINNVDKVKVREINELWEYSKKPQYFAMYEGGDYSSLAAYLVRQCKTGLKEGERLNSKAWSCSRNIRKPAVIKDTEISKICWKEPPTPKVGYFIDRDSIDAGVNEFNGRPYLFYRQIKRKEVLFAVTTEGVILRSAEARKYVRRTWPDVKEPDKFSVVTDTGQLLLGETADRYLRELNRRDIKNNWKDIAEFGKITKKEKKENEGKEGSDMRVKNMDYGGASLFRQ